MVNMRQREKFHGHWSYHCCNMVIFQFLFKMAAARHLGLVMRVFGPSRKCVISYPSGKGPAEAFL